MDSTKTMNEETFIALREATAPGTYTDEVMRFYWSKLIGVPVRYDDEFNEGRADYEPINKASHYAKEALWGAIGHETYAHDFPCQSPELILNLAKDYLLEDDPNLSPHHLSLPEVWNEFADGDGSDCLAYGFGVSFPQSGDGVLQRGALVRSVNNLTNPRYLANLLTERIR
jgi:hypothetical protein